MSIPTNPSWAKLHRRPDLPFIAGGSDIPDGAPVKLVTDGTRAVRVAVSSADHPIGVSRASAPAQRAVAVQDRGEIVRAFAAATVASGEYVGVASVTATAGASGNIQIPVIAPVAKASGSVVWAVGLALEHANPGNVFQYLVEPTQLSGLA
jgi:hypothetical protein